VINPTHGHDRVVSTQDVFVSSLTLRKSSILPYPSPRHTTARCQESFLSCIHSLMAFSPPIRRSARLKAQHLDQSPASHAPAPASKHWTTSSKNTEMDTEQHHHDLMVLPLELREMVYQYALAIGCTPILRVSRQIHDEAAKFVSVSAYLRLEAFKLKPKDFCGWLKVLYSTQLHQIKNIAVRVDLSRPHYRQWLLLILLPCVHHRTYEITLFASTFTPQIFDLDLTIFAKSYCDKVLIRICTGQESENELYPLDRGVIFKAMILHLNGTCGPEKWHGKNGKGEEYLEFHPYAYKMARNGDTNHGDAGNLCD